MGVDQRQIIIDTKFYASALAEHYRKPLLHSGNLYQLFAYLKNAEGLGPEFAQTEGILLYPAVGAPLGASYQMQAHRITTATANLDQPWHQIRRELLSLIGSH
jgi:5-methylcytosine-specific restriction enzyme subunit McrC